GSRSAAPRRATPEVPRERPHTEYIHTEYLARNLDHGAGAGAVPRLPRPRLGEAQPAVRRGGDLGRAPPGRRLARHVELCVPERDHVAVARADEEPTPHVATGVLRPHDPVRLVVLEHRV